jgi:uncharacterized protein
MEFCAIIARMISRTLYPILLNRLEQFPAVALLGPRQVGKTTLAQQVGEGRPSIYLDLESPSDRSKLSDPVLFLRRHSHELVILDEVQRIPELFATLRGLIDEGKRKGLRTGRFLLLGSASMELLQQSRESLAGRIAYLELNPLHIQEVPDLHKLWVRGGFPDSFLAKDNKQSVIWRENFIRTYLERDIPALGPRIPAETLRRFWTMLAHNQGALLNAAQLARSLAVDGKTVARYLDLLVDLLLVRKLTAWHNNHGKRLVKSPKIYIRDSGMTHALLGIANFDQLLSHPVVGTSFEGFVIENLLSVLQKQCLPSFYRTAAGSEIDLVLELPGKELWTIEIKRGLVPKIEKGFHHACEDLKPTRCFVVYGGEDHYPLTKNIAAVSLYKLMEILKNYN